MRVFGVVVAACAVAALAVLSVIVPRLDSPSEGASSTASAFEGQTLIPHQNPNAQDVARALDRVKRPVDPVALPEHSGKGRRVVLSQSDQRVWLVKSDGSILRTYLVSGSEHNNLHPGTYQVAAHFRHATAYDHASHMQYFVQFARGDNAAIGFHDIPVSNSGKPLQTKDELGTRLSSGCIRQYRPNAIALWKFAPVGTTVVVVR